jgi:hypothetical protein
LEGKLANETDNKSGAGGDLPDPLKDGLKAVANSLRQTSATLSDDEAARTMLVGKRGGGAVNSLQNALRAADAALTPGTPKPNNPADATIVNRPAKSAASPAPMPPQKTQLVRGAQKPVRSDFAADPVVGWLVIIGGPGLGAYRPIFEGNNTIGRNASQRIPIDFGDDAISAEEQAFLRYDSADRQFLLVPNLAKTNVIAVNEAKPTAAVKLAAMDVITMGRTQLVFVPFCGNDFDWSELAGLKE